MEEQQISGTIVSITFQNEINGYTVLDFTTGDGDIFTAVGNLAALTEGERVTLSGFWSVHPSYGRQFQVKSVEREQIKTAEDQYNYLASGAIRGIRAATARRIIEAFGEKTFDIISHDPVRLSTVKGISKERAKEISDEFNKTFSEREIIISLEKYGISASESIKIFKALGSRAVDELERNPYIICDELIGMTFEKAESVAEKFEVKPDDIYRNTAGILNVLRHNLSNGHTCIPKTKVVSTASGFLGVSEDEAEKALNYLSDNKSVVCTQVKGKPYVFLKELFDAESKCAHMLKVINKFSASGSAVTEEKIQQIEVIHGIVYNDIQKRAIRTAVEKGILVLTGGPGTGKTTTIRAIINLFDRDGVETVLCAPTGRAAKRMSELTGYEAKTIHRLLEVEWDRNDKPVYTRNAQNPIDAEALIVDEMSMVDVRLFAALLDALPLTCRLIMVGDSDQLPPVGAGNVLQDIINSGIIPVVELKEVLRQALKSSIVVNAHRIVRGEMPDLTIRNSDFFFLDRKNTFTAAETIADLVSRRLPEAYNYSPFNDIQVISPSRIGETGTESLNKRLQEALNPKSKGKTEFISAGRVLREGDKIMQTKNNYDLEW
ncbi:MAG: AAA family ATPase, partial [Clostridia bacterium]|nr:AAA family ATPase [Clostridia bacterium]